MYQTGINLCYLSLFFNASGVFYPTFKRRTVGNLSPFFHPYSSSLPSYI